MTVKVYSTPGAPGTVLDANDGEPVALEAYRSYVGKLIFFGTKVGPTMVNAVRDAARFMSNLEKINGLIWKGL